MARLAVRLGAPDARQQLDRDRLHPSGQDARVSRVAGGAAAVHLPGVVSRPCCACGPSAGAQTPAVGFRAGAGGCMGHHRMDARLGVHRISLAAARADAAGNMGHAGNRASASLHWHLCPVRPCRIDRRTDAGCACRAPLADCGRRRGGSLFAHVRPEPRHRGDAGCERAPIHPRPALYPPVGNQRRLQVRRAFPASPHPAAINRASCCGRKARCPTTSKRATPTAIISR